MDISLIETLRFEPGLGYVRLERHLARLSRSAAALGLHGADEARETLERTARAATSEGPLRVRLELFPDGRIEIATAPYVPLPPETVWRVRIAATRLDSANPLLRHKTSRRAVYEAARAEFTPDEANEVLLLNERGEVCEGTITSIFLDDGSGILKTPPLECGLLAGILREELIETGKAAEKPLPASDLARYPLYLGNSLRGLVRGTKVR
ncbi:aminotransferase class IV family protein [Sinorhizobium sp. BG8]|uniref:aminotransferase class IV family protein n=1 Tax=Sinorhizobium sp. BG8 TaxID=2613773 RepID=UPI001FEE0949|nr:aminotransferase class IV family protein [Sinorhizobium sp. BG8]